MLQQDIEDAFKVYTKEGVIKFMQNKEGLNVYWLSEKYLKIVAEAKRMTPPGKSHSEKVRCMVSTVNEK